MIPYPALDVDLCFLLTTSSHLYPLQHVQVTTIILLLATTVYTPDSYF